VGLGVLRAVARRTSRILLYHGIGEAGRPDDPHHLVVDEVAFRVQLQLLQDAGFEFVTVAELAERIPPGGEPPPGLVAISFDDGMEDNFSRALPILSELGVPATVYVLTGAIGAENPWLPGERMMTANELEAMARSGIELGAHTVTHPDLSSLPFDECLSEIESSRDRVEAITGTRPHTFAYPFGHYGPAAMNAVRDAGFSAAVTCINRGSWAPLELKRTLITGRDGVASFVARVSGAYEPLVLGRAGVLSRRATIGLRRRLRERRGG
jgi:peptidoglycan/xylan/chitin deacetylase (PgdA/CDA1 family)